MKELELFKSKLGIPTLVKQLQTMDQVECPVQHHFADGQYIRETHMPKGTFAIGKKHRYSTMNILQANKKG